MMAYGLFEQGFPKKATEIIQETFLLSTNSEKSQIFPGVPSYFGPNDKGAYAYLTGSSTWLLLTVTTQLFGVKGIFGNLSIEPKLANEFYNEQGHASINFTFRGIRINLIYKISDQSESKGHQTSNITINGKAPLNVTFADGKYLLNYEELINICQSGNNQIIVLTNLN